MANFCEHFSVEFQFGAERDISIRAVKVQFHHTCILRWSTNRAKLHVAVRSLCCKCIKIRLETL